MVKPTNIEIKKFNDLDFDIFAQMVGVYFIEDLEETLNHNPPIGMCKAMTQAAKDGIIHLDLLHLDDTAIGFIMYQVDSPESNWCEKEGYGFIREMYIRKDHRKQGYGKVLVAHAENELKKLSVPYIYLTSSNDDFWLGVGYVETGEVCEKNSLGILIKQP
ncbi:MAG: GNAT family N-acetyltransferase [Defluviitaleaceae bacterium]|nr:GNAT family N-acetyltransferase [Defluviitaleaceae bacterium]